MSAYLEIDAPVAELVFDDPDRMNAMTAAMFDGLESALVTLAAREDVVVVIVRGNGRAFSAGFDLRSASNDVAILESFILRLSGVCRGLRRLPQVVIAAVHGAAIAGGCAVLSACDLAVVAPKAKIGYPVHILGISPAVSFPTLQKSIGPGPARALQLSGERIDGATAHALGLASHLAQDAETVLPTTRALAATIAGHGPNALRVTKRWLNTLDGTDRDAAYDAVAIDTARAATGEETRERLAAFWGQRGG
ncbi:MAG: enoyl-CoA hydratase/isomerase family protein [Planctomycetota bacterium]|jgi:methylglutaconyl-CoA hydratase